MNKTPETEKKVERVKRYSRKQVLDISRKHPAREWVIDTDATHLKEERDRLKTTVDGLAEEHIEMSKRIEQLEQENKRLSRERDSFEEGCFEKDRQIADLKTELYHIKKTMDKIIPMTEDAYGHECCDSFLKKGGE